MWRHRLEFIGRRGVVLTDSIAAGVKIHLGSGRTTCVRPDYIGAPVEASKTVTYGYDAFNQMVARAKRKTSGPSGSPSRRFGESSRR